MEKTVNERYQESYYSETLDNGLKVIIWEKPDYANTVCFFATPFGAINLEVENHGKKHRFNAGLAHFLEHLMFKGEDFGDVMVDFTKMACQINAFTSYFETVYHFSTVAKDIKEPLNLLLDFVQKFKTNDDLVAGEKEIIFSEYKMDLQVPERRLIMETYRALYHNLPINEDIAGNEKSIFAITKEELMLAHQLSYHPANMVLAIVSPLSAHDIMEIVKANQAAKDFIALGELKNTCSREPVGVVKDYHEVKMELGQAKIGLAYKFNLPPLEKKALLRLDIIAAIWVYAYFTANNADYQQWLDDKLINYSFSAGINISDTASFMFLGGDLISENFVEYFDNYLRKLKEEVMSEEELEQLKNRYVGRSLCDLNSAEDIAVTTIRYGWWDTELLESIDLIRGVQWEDFAQLLDLLDFEQKTVVKLL